MISGAAVQRLTVKAPVRAPFANTGAVQCLRKLNAIYVLRCVVTDHDKLGSPKRRSVPAGVTRVLQSVLELVLRKPLHAAVCQTHVALLGVHVVHPADGGL